MHFETDIVIAYDPDPVGSRIKVESPVSGTSQSLVGVATNAVGNACAGIDGVEPINASRRVTPRVELSGGRPKIYPCDSLGRASQPTYTH